MAQTASNVTDLNDYAKKRTPAQWHQYWADELKASNKRVQNYHKWGNQIVARFLDERSDGSNSLYTAGYRGVQDQRLNLFWTNVSTQLKMLYGQTPKIAVEREHHDPDDDMARVAALILKRILDADVYQGAEDFGTTLRAALQDRLLPGMGIARVRYEATYTTEKQIDWSDAAMGVVEVEVVDQQTCKCEYVHWQDYRWGWCRTRAEMPWEAFRSFMTRDEAAARFGEKVAANLAYKEQTPAGGEKSEDDPFNPEQKSNVEKAEIWEIWAKKDRKVYWWSEGASLILDVRDDPLGLDNFWTTPQPIIANPTTTLFMPKADFVLAQDLYNEVDELTSRINTITEAVKVVGVYDASETDSVGRMLKEGVENDMIPVQNWALFGEKGGLKGAVDWFPVQEIAGVLQTLLQLRDQTIELLYQVTGMSDILRGGNTDQYTSDGTNQLKAKFGSIRIQALQDEFAKFASDLDALKCEVISKHFNEKSIYVQSNAQFLPQADQDKIQPAIGLIKSPAIKWRVDIRPESLAMVDYAQLKSERTEFLTALATYLQSSQAMVQAVPQSLPILLELLKWGMAGFKGSDYLEGTMDQAIEMAKKMPPPGQDNGQKEAQAQQAEMQKLQMKHQNDMQLVQAKGQSEMQKIMADHQAALREISAKSDADIKKIGADLQADLKQIAVKLGVDLQVERAQSGYAMQERELEHEHNMTEQQQEHRDNMAETRAQPSPSTSDA